MEMNLEKWFISEIYIYNFMLKRKTNFILLFFFAVSCSSPENKENLIQWKALPYASDLVVGEKSFGEQINLLQPGDIINVDDRYLVISDADENAIFKVFSLPELEYLYSWGQRGQGPDEFEFVPLNEINTVEDKLIIYDINSQKLFYYIVNDSTFIPNGNRSLSYKGQTNILSHVTRLNDSLFMADYGLDNISNNEFIALQPGKEEAPNLTFGSYPSSELEGFERYFEFIKTSAASEEVGKIVAFYLYHNLFKIFDIEGKELVKVQIEDEFITEIRNHSESFMYRTVEWVSDKYLYVMGVNEHIDIIEDNIESFTPSLEVWNWDGEQVYRAMFDKPINKFTVSEKYNMIYAYSVNNTDKIYAINIPNKISSN